MSVSRFTVAGGANDFNLNLGGTYTSIILDKEYSAGSYSLVSGNNDTSLDVYGYNSAGTLAGYTSTKSFNATIGFNKLVILGGQSGDVLSFSYKTTYTTTADSDEITSGPFIETVATSSLPSSTSSVVITGGNFATDITATFGSASTSSTYTAAVVRTSVNSITVTRGNNGTLTTALAPWVLTLSNPGVNDPIGSNVNKSSFTVGSAPVWSTSTSLPAYTKSVAYSQTLTATDADGAVTYSIVTDSLPPGLSYNTTTSVLSGTPSDVTSGTLIVRATDTGGNFVDRTFSVINIGAAAPVWTTAAGALTGGAQGNAYTTTVVATDDSGSQPTYAVTAGALPTGLSLASNGVISGTPSVSGSFSFTITASDANATGTARAFTLYLAAAVSVSYTSGSGTFNYPSSALTAFGVEVLVVAGGGAGGDSGATGGGGGAGGLVYGTISLTPGSNYSYSIGSGVADRGGNPNNTGPSGGNTTFHTITAYGGGGGAGNGQAPNNGGGGCGGGGANSGTQTGAAGGVGGVAISGTTAYANGGGNWTGGTWSWGSGGGGGGAGGAGNSGTGPSGNRGGSGRTYAISGSSYTYSIGGDGGYGNGGDGINAYRYGEGGGGIVDGAGGASFRGCVILKYYA